MEGARDLVNGVDAVPLVIVIGLAQQRPGCPELGNQGGVGATRQGGPNVMEQERAGDYQC
jgi:hypothetical protein